ncbi:MAG: tetratricopeptide repeat protein [Bryobacterales bacterium]|nr:tetratricopeptide repeat protein [Bryobacterales bacterium]
MILRVWFRAHWRVVAMGAVAALAASGVAVSLAAADDPVSELKAAVVAAQSRRDAAALAALRALAKTVPQLADYIAWFAANVEFSQQDYAAVPQSLDAVWTQSPPSPLAGRAALLAAQALQKSGNAADALNLLRKHYMVLAQPQGDLAMAAAFAANNDPVSAAVYAQHVYYGYPTAAEAADAGALLATVRDQLGDRYPPAMGNVMLGRALKLLEAGQSDKARKELAVMAPQLGGAERDTALVKLGVAGYNIKDTHTAQRYLEGLTVESPPADAERLYYLVLCARRFNNRDAMREALDKLARLRPDSTWRLEALLAVGNSYLVENQVDAYEPVYRACYESFPKEPHAAGCHWKVTWAHYLRRQDDAGDLLREHLRMFPNSDESSAALYFLGRLAANAGDAASARDYYSEIVREYPNYFYATVARERLAELGPVSAASSSGYEFLRTVAFTTRSRTRNFDANTTARLRLERARLLAGAGLEEWVEGELRYAAQSEDQPHVMALELASMASHRSADDQGIRYLKRYAPDYLYLPVESAPREFWKLAFPLPYRADMERFAKDNNLDVYLLAALARQESEFNPQAVSVANARGLTQILPSTGRELSRRLGIRAYSTARLFQPRVNLQLGSYYLRSVADSLEGRWEAALAAYNAGLSRAKTWSTWGEFREPAEFVETVPFSQTHDYIQIVLRNADIYRRIYSNQPPAGKQPPAPAVTEAAVAEHAVAGGAGRVSYSHGVDQRKKSSRATGAR